MNARDLHARAVADADLLCPSSRAHFPDSVVIGVLGGTAEAPRIVPTDRAFPATPEVLALAGPVEPTEVFRFASRCQQHGCSHFEGGACQLARGAVHLLEEVTDELPRCSVRAQCRWFHQQGPAMCRRCPQIVTDQLRPSGAAVQIVSHILPAPRAA